MTRTPARTSLALLLAASILTLLPTGAAGAAGAAGAPGPAPSTRTDTDPSPGHRYRIEPFELRPDDAPRLARAWRAWENSETTVYATVVRRSCECIQRPPLRTEVARRYVDSVTYQGRDREARRHGYEMEQLYRVLRKAYAEADDVHVTYTDTGVPRSIYVDWDEALADEELSLRVGLRRPHPIEDGPA